MSDSDAVMVNVLCVLPSNADSPLTCSLLLFPGQDSLPEQLAIFNLLATLIIPTYSQLTLPTRNSYCPNLLATRTPHLAFVVPTCVLFYPMLISLYHWLIPLGKLSL